MSDLINARGNFATHGLGAAVSQALRDAAEQASLAYGRGQNDPGLASLRSAADYVSSVDRAHPLMWALTVGHSASGQWAPGPGPMNVMSLVGGSLNPIRPEIVFAELAVANLEDQIGAERVKARESDEKRVAAEREAEAVGPLAERVAQLEQELAGAHATNGDVASELAEQVRINEFLSARYADETKPSKSKPKAAVS